MKRFIILLICLTLCLSCISAYAADGFIYSKDGSLFNVTTTKEDYAGSTFLLVKFSQDESDKTCEVMVLTTVDFSGGSMFTSGIFTLEPGYNYKYMVFDGLTPLTRSIIINTNSPDGFENTSDDEGSPRY